MSTWDEMTEAIGKISKESTKRQPKTFTCHPFQFQEAIMRGIIMPDGNAMKDHHIMEVFFIEIHKV